MELRVIVLALAGAVLTLLSWNGYRAHMDAQLLRAWPDGVLAKPALARYAENRARPIYDRHCATCHGQDLQGDRLLGSPNLKDREWIYGDGRVAEIEQTILYGIRSGHHRAHNLADMPAFGRPRPYQRYSIPPLAAQQIGDVTEYLLALQKKDHDRSAAARGFVVFSGPGQCFDCHTPDATGDNFAGAPSLVDQVWLQGKGDRRAITDIITYGRGGVCPAWVDRLRPAEIRALAVYIHDRATRPRRPEKTGSRS